MDEPLYHGGQRGLGLGSFILPPCESRARHTLLETAQRNGLGSPARADRVYLTSSRLAAVMYAVGHPSKGWVYRVEPLGELEADPDCTLEGLSFQVARARIVEVIKPTSEERRTVLEAFRGGR